MLIKKGWEQDESYSREEFNLKSLQIAGAGLIKIKVWGCFHIFDWLALERTSRRLVPARMTKLNESAGMKRCHAIQKSN